MNVQELEQHTRREFNTAISLIGVIPLTVFIYLLVSEISSFNIVTGRVGTILMITIILFLLGLTVARNMLWRLIQRLFDYSEEILKLQNELIEKNRLAAVTETALALSHEVNNPLMIMRGNIELLKDELNASALPGDVKKKIETISSHCERIRLITEKLSALKKPVTTTIHGDTKMIDADRSA